MQSNSTHITLILDRTGSMESIRDDTIGGFNAFLAEQQRQPGAVTLTLVQFDSQDPYEVLANFAPIGTIAPLTLETYVPRASTPLLDALGRGINDLGQTLAAMPRDRRPDQIVFVVVTDGQENASHEFTKTQVSQMIKERQQQDWQFVFLSADLAAITDAETSGVRPSHVMAFDKTGQGTASAWQAMSKNTSSYRARLRQDMAFEEVDRKQQQSEQQRKGRSS
jgi:Mg-chelatase subunit ChlD